MRYVKMEKRHRGNNLQCRACRATLRDGVLNLVSFKGDHVAARNFILCNVCAEFIGTELISFAKRKSSKELSPTNIILEYELRMARTPKDPAE